jgi:4-amino-4-deoxy-L-arabinose transferase-like glycosyltransferase
VTTDAMTTPVQPAAEPGAHAAVVPPLATPPERPADPRWARPALLVLLATTAVLYLWGLGASGWANSFYSAAAQAGSQSWKAFFFGSFDAANLITVDKPPASMWVMGLSARVFGVSSWSILVPEALMGVATVGVLYAAVRRWFGAVAGLVAGAALALTPVATLMFRFNNPDALLVLLMTIGAYAMVRAVEKASTRWLLISAAVIGLAFLTKMLQAYLVLPGFVFMYLVAAPTPLRRRFGQLFAALGVLLVASGWWVAVVQLWPASSRPFVGGSQNNSVLDLLFGYNGFGRLTGDETGSVTGGGGGNVGGMWGQTGLTRMFSSEFGGQVAWLLPAALILLVAMAVISLRAPRTDRLRASAILWGGWLLVTALVFSLGKGIIHSYYAVALAPAIGALVGIGAVVLWRRRDQLVARLVLTGTLAVTAWWSVVLLGRSADWQPWLRPLVLAGGLAVAALLLVVTRLPKRAGVVLAIAGLTVALAGPAAYAVQTASTPHTGALPTAGPTVAGGTGRGTAGQRPGGFPQGGAFPQRGALPQGGTPPQGLTPPTGAQGFGPSGTTSRGGGAGGLLDASTPSSALVALLLDHADSYTWVAATVGSNQAAGYQLATDRPVMALGGFNGSDPFPTLALFQQYVAAGKVHYFLAGGGGFGNQNGGSEDSQAISQWVEASFTATTVGGVTVYDLTQPTTGSTSA